REHFGIRPLGRFVQVLDETGKRSSNIRNVDIPMSMETLERVSKGETVFETVTVAKEKIRLVTLPIFEKGRMVGIVQVGSPLEEIEEALRQLLLILLVAVPSVLILAVVGGLFLANKALRPVDEITNTARKIGSSGDLSQRIRLKRKVDDEIGRLAATFNEMIAKVENSFQQIKRFTADASHELKTPLTILRGEIEVGLKRLRTPEEYQKILASNLEEVKHMSRMVEDLLTLARADMGALELRKEVVDLGGLVREVWEEVRLWAEDKGVELLFQEDGEARVMGDRGRLRQLALNLIDNAIKYTPSGGRVELRVVRDGDEVTFSVADTGEGIPAEDLQRIFERFYRVDKARSRQRGGTGLGLSICKWIAEAHGGRISAESELGRGSKFHVFLPLYRGS
ncbi:MAG: histidine kinase, partial [Deltaproteobacteria bacterium]